MNFHKAFTCMFCIFKADLFRYIYSRGRIIKTNCKINAIKAIFRIRAIHVWIIPVTPLLSTTIVFHQVRINGF